MRAVIAGLAAAMLSLAGARAAQPAKAKPVLGPSPIIATLFTPDMLNADRAFVEQKLGPAKYVRGDERTYTVAGCAVEITYQGDAVRNMTIDGLSSRCTFSLAGFFPERKVGDAASLTFGEFSDVFQGARYLPSCFGSCGNSADPSLSAYFSGPHVEQFYEVMISNSYPYRGAGADKAIDAVLKATAEKRQDPMYDADCDPAAAMASQVAFADVPLKRITVGWDLDGNPARCGR